MILEDLWVKVLNNITNRRIFQRGHSLTVGSQQIRLALILRVTLPTSNISVHMQRSSMRIIQTRVLVAQTFSLAAVVLLRLTRPWVVSNKLPTTRQQLIVVIIQTNLPYKISPKAVGLGTRMFWSANPGTRLVSSYLCTNLCQANSKFRTWHSSWLIRQVSHRLIPWNIS